MEKSQFTLTGELTFISGNLNNSLVVFFFQALFVEIALLIHQVFAIPNQGLTELAAGIRYNNTFFHLTLPGIIGHGFHINTPLSLHLSGDKNLLPCFRPRQYLVPGRYF